MHPVQIPITLPLITHSDTRVCSVRYPRTTAIQKMGVEARDQSLNVDWSSGCYTKRLAQPAAWLHAHDCVEQAYKEFGKAADAVAKGYECTFGGVPIHENEGS